MSRRQFLSSLGGVSLIYAFRFTSDASTQTANYDVVSLDDNSKCIPQDHGIDYTEWIVFTNDGKVSVFTNRTELGQGLKTVITATVTQGLEVTQDKLTVVQGDTDLCPNDGGTYGSAATMLVAWAMWKACLQIRGNIVSRAADILGIPAKSLRFLSGGVGLKGASETLITIPELGNGETVVMDINPKTVPLTKQYEDKKIPNVNGEQIVTGQLKYVGDLYEPGMYYAGWYPRPYHWRITRLNSVDMSKARALPGIKMVDVVNGNVAVVGERYSDVLKAFPLIKTSWSEPNRPRELKVEEEARQGAELEWLKDQKGDVDAGLASASLVISETYKTQYAHHAPMETDTSLALIDKNTNRIKVWASTQWPYYQRELIANHLRIDQSQVRVIAQPAGGAFGGKIGNTVNREAAKISKVAGVPIKLIYSRRDQFKLRSKFKFATVIDITTGVDANGKIIARKIDSFQDEAEGSLFTYDIPNTLTKSYKAPWPFNRAVMRGTSFVQTCFAIESNMDVLAHRLGIDPFEFRKMNVLYPAYKTLLDKCAEMIGYGTAQLEPDEGIGVALVMHGGAQLGVIAARVAVNRTTGKVTVKHICVAFDIGTVVNINTATVTIRGGVAMGIGYVFNEEVMVNGHYVETGYLSEYKIPRFSDMPPIDITFQDTHQPPGTVRGCGEMPVIPTIGSIANAIYNAIGIRFYSTPITPEKIKQALGTG
jgi:isoquinoline 1-oxidoreductase